MPGFIQPGVGSADDGEIVRAAADLDGHAPKKWAGDAQVARPAAQNSGQAGRAVARPLPS